MTNLFFDLPIDVQEQILEIIKVWERKQINQCKLFH